MKLPKQEFKTWKKQSESSAKKQGYPIKIIGRKWNTLKTILMIISILMIILVTFEVAIVGADLIPTIQNNNGTITMKIIHEIGLTPELKNYIETKAPEIWSMIKQEFGK